jgi:hypothetical protein
MEMEAFAGGFEHRHLGQCGSARVIVLFAYYGLPTPSIGHPTPGEVKVWCDSFKRQRRAWGSPL